MAIIAPKPPKAPPGEPPGEPRAGASAPRGLRYLRIAAWSFTLPALLFQFFFGWFPILLAFLVAFQRYYLVRPAQMVGLSNFHDVAVDPLTPQVFGNTFYY